MQQVVETYNFFMIAHQVNHLYHILDQVFLRLKVMVVIIYSYDLEVEKILLPQNLMQR